MGVGVNTAARLMAHCQPYDILCDETTCKQCERAISFKNKGTVALKGFKDELTIFRPVAFLHKETDFEQAIGNEGELSELEAMVEIVAESHSNLIIIMGKPGTGKHTIGKWKERRRREEKEKKTNIIAHAQHTISTLSVGTTSSSS